MPFICSSPDVPAEQQHADIAVVGAVLSGAAQSVAFVLAHPRDIYLVANDSRDRSVHIEHGKWNLSSDKNAFRIALTFVKYRVIPLDLGC